MNYLNVARRIQPDAMPETLVSLIDLSPSMDEEDWPPSRKAAALKANLELVKIKAKRHPDDRVAVIGFWGTATMLHGPIALRDGLPSIRYALRNPTGGLGTNFTRALELAEQCLFSAPSSSSPARSLSSMIAALLYDADPQRTSYGRDQKHCTETIKRIVLLSDGEHNAGRSPIGMAKRLKNMGVVIDCIGIGGSPQCVDEELLKEIASRNPDGTIRYCFIGDQQELLRRYQDLARHIRCA